MTQLIQKSAGREGLARDSFEWLLHSGIQACERDPEYQGGVSAWFDLRDQTYPFIYSEITGYAVNAFLFYHEFLEDGESLEAARRAADWLIRHAEPATGLIRTRLNYANYDRTYFDTSVFTFDQWIVVYGLACLGEVTGAEAYLGKAKSLAEFLLDRTVREDGAFLPIFNFVSMTAGAPGNKWSRQCGTFHAKALMALRKLCELTGGERYQAAALNLARWAQGRQEPDGRFVTQDEDASTHLHPHAYTLEGLLSFALPMRSRNLLEAVDKGVKWILDRQLDNGSVPVFFQGGAFRPAVRADVLAQTLRLGSILRRCGYCRGYDGHLERLRDSLLQYRISQGPQQGGFLYGQEEDGQIHYHVNAWVTMFSAQALWLYENLVMGDLASYDMAFFV